MVNLDSSTENWGFDFCEIGGVGVLFLLKIL